MQNLQNVICITDRHLCHRPFQDQMRIVASKHPRAIILREKDVMEDAYGILLDRLIPICEEYNVPLIAHTYYQVALEKGVHGVKVPLAVLRELPEETKKQFISIGTTVHSVEDAKEAVALGATHLTASLATGGSAEKYGEQNKLLAFLEDVCQAVDVPVYAMGGASREDLNDCLEKGAAGICMMSRLMTIDDE